MSKEKNQNLTENDEPAPKEPDSQAETEPGGHESGGETPPAEPSLEEQLEAARAESKDHYDRYVRAVAEMENFRRRAQREKDEARKYGVTSLIEDLLPVLDNFGLGLEAAVNHPEAKGFAQGFEMVHQQIKSVLKEHGVEEINPRGEAFDPHRHESTGYVPHDEIQEGNVVAVSRKGYVLNDRLIRPAMVLLSSGAATPETKEEGQGETEPPADEPSEET